MDQHGIALELIALSSVTGIIPVYLGIGIAWMTLKALNRSRDTFLAACLSEGSACTTERRGSES